jgi:hypothetical protein
VNATAIGSICVMVTSELLPGCTRLPSRTEISAGAPGEVDRISV